MRDEDLHLHQKEKHADDTSSSLYREKTASKRNFGSGSTCEKNNCSKNQKHGDETCYFPLGAARAAPANDENQNYDCEDEESEGGDVMDHDLAYEADAEGDEAVGAEEEVTSTFIASFSVYGYAL